MRCCPVTGRQLFLGVIPMVGITVLVEMAVIIGIAAIVIGSNVTTLHYLMLIPAIATLVVFPSMLFGHSQSLLRVWQGCTTAFIALGALAIVLPMS
ncbi:MAG: hypothetical protein HQL54_07685 [Magnetococcales bacterium]|nr:hypothetical protein [Magnetococcales bacterium]